MSLKGNTTPVTHVPLCSGANTDKPLDVCVHLRAWGVDARYVSATKVKAVVLVPPEQLAKAKRLWTTYLKEPTELLEDYRKVKARRATELTTA